MTGIEHSDRSRDAAADRRAWWRACQFTWLLLLVYWIIAALSIDTELARHAHTAPPFLPWVLEGSSVLVTGLLVPGIMWLGVQAPVEPGRWLSVLPIHVAGFLAYSTLHIAGMVLLREAIWIGAYGGNYEFFHGHPVREIIYEMRKDAGTYLGFQVIVGVTRALQHYRLEADVARREARSRHRLTLKCGGRTLHLDADAFESAKAAGNYVEVRLDSGSHLARTTLAELQKQLREAGVDAVRVHRSWLANRAAIREIAPTGEGDVTITLTSGETLPGSRRYRDRLEAA